MANMLKTLLAVAFVSYTEASMVVPIDAFGAANYCETTADCGGSVKAGYSCGWYKRHEGAMEGRCIPTSLCGKRQSKDEENSVMICKDPAP